MSRAFGFGNELRDAVGELAVNAGVATDHREDGEHDERDRERETALVRVPGFVRAGFAEESDLPHADHVERREHGSEGEDGEHRGVFLHREVEDGVLREEARETRHTDDGEDADGEREERERHLLLQAAHLENILLVVAAHDDGAGAEEEQRLEEGVGREVEHRGTDAGG